MINKVTMKMIEIKLRETDSKLCKLYSIRSFEIFRDKSKLKFKEKGRFPNRLSFIDVTLVFRNKIKRFKMLSNSQLKNCFKNFGNEEVRPIKL